MKIVDDERNFTLLRKLANLIARDGGDAEEIFDGMKQAYKLGKTEGGVEAAVRQANEGVLANG